MRMSAVTCGRQCLCVAGLLLQFLILLKCSVITVTITTPLRLHEYNNNTNSIAEKFTTLRGISHTITQCLTTTEQWKCLEEQFTRYVDIAAQDNSTWHLGDYILVEPLTANKSTGQMRVQAIKPHQRSFQVDDTHAHSERGIVGSLLELAKSRALRFKLPSSTKAIRKIGAGISDVIDVLALESITPAAVTTTEAAHADEGTHRILNGHVDDKVDKLFKKLTVLSGNSSNSNNTDVTIHLQNDKDKFISDRDKTKIKNSEKNKNKPKDQKKIIINTKNIFKKGTNKFEDKDNNKTKYKSKDKNKDKNKKKKVKQKDKNKYKKRKKIKEGLFLYETSLKARKKKDKDKNMAMMGGMAMIAMIAQMFFGKVILIAGAAFVMAKIALVVSVLGSLKKSSAGSSGSTTEHIVVTGQAHGSTSGGEHAVHSYESGWHRSMPHIHPETEIFN